MLKQLFYIFLFVYYTLGVICLPLGNFSTIIHLPQMYNHCKATEDPNLNLGDFIVEHLMNLDGIFEPHETEEEDSDKPHQMVDFFQNNPITPIKEKIEDFEFKNSNGIFSFDKKPSCIFKNQIYSYNHRHSIFRPPISFS